tara:strand:+ start:286 stop:495 length:210 start_codon:yes stop_codon:yes gene_type:complete
MANAWQMHVKKVSKENPGLMLKDVLKLAAKSYKKSATAGPTKKATKKPKKKTAKKKRKSGKKKRKSGKK